MHSITLERVISSLIMISIGFCLSGCQSLKIDYTYRLDSVNTSKKGQDFETKKIIPTGFYSDSVLSIGFDLDETYLNFEIRNESNVPLKILWDEAMFSDFMQKTKRVVHSGVKLTEKNNPQVPSLIAPHSTLADYLLPAESIFWKEGSSGGYLGSMYLSPTAGEWKILPWIDKIDKANATDADMRGWADLLRASNGALPIKIILPISYQGETIYYTFDFSVIFNVKVDGKPYIFDSEPSLQVKKQKTIIDLPAN